MAIEIILSEDGSHTLYNSELNETYHSHHGALQESLHVFIDKGLNYLSAQQNEITILEVGFGTGLNALLTYIWAEQNKRKVVYHTLEPFPLSEIIYTQLNYPQLLGREDLKELFYRLHSTQQGESLILGEFFTFNLYFEKLEHFSAQIKADLVYYDAFAPSKQPELWELENFKKSKSLLRDNGVLVSYCASGQFKRNLKEAGFQIESLPGPPGKKEMTRGVLL